MHLDTIDSIAPDSSGFDASAQDFGRCPSWRESAIRDVRTSLPLLIGDLLAVMASWILSKLVAVLCLGTTTAPGLNSLIAIIIAFPIAAYCLGLFPGVLLHPSEELKRIVLGVSLAFAGFLIAAFVDRDFFQSHLAVCCIHYFVLLTCAISARASARSLLSKSKWWKQPVLVLGDETARRRVEHWLERNGGLGLYAADSWIPTNKAFVTSPEMESHKLIWRFRELWHISFLRGEPSVIRTAANQLYFVEHQICKRVFDVTLLLITAPLIIPLMSIIAMLVKMTSSGPVCVSHKQMGYGRQLFSVWTFRLTAQPSGLAPVQPPARATDVILQQTQPYDTKIGCLLRRSGFDKLPYLWSVLRGDMSIVGPGPIRENEIEPEMIPEFAHRIKNGLTGQYRALGPACTSHDRLEYDAYYVTNWSLWLDLYLIIQSIRNHCLSRLAMAK